MVHHIIYIIIGDKAFPLKPNLLWPYPGHDLALIMLNAASMADSLGCAECWKCISASPPWSCRPMLFWLCRFPYMEKCTSPDVTYKQNLIGPEILLVRARPEKSLCMQSHWHWQLGLGYSYQYRCGKTPYYVHKQQWTDFSTDIGII